jgi:hypothetical protein
LADEEIRPAVYDEFGEALVDDFASVRTALEKHLAEWSDSDEKDDNEDAAPKKGLPEKKKKNSLTLKHGKAGRLLETASACLQNSAETSKTTTPFAML